VEQTVEKTKEKTGGDVGLKKSGKIQIVRVLVVLAIQTALFFIAAGTLDLPRAWVFFGINLVYGIVSTLIVAKLNPQLINERKGGKEGTKPEDKIFLPLYLITGLLLHPIVMGLDLGRFHWMASLGLICLGVGYLIFLLSAVVNVWALVENQYFEATVRIQDDRSQQVVSTGPYRMVRHPGYLAGIMWAFAAPLAIGSFVGVLFAIPVALILILRTAFEDKTLHRELDGYHEYAGRVKARLFPGIW
jgi:protein-S-isoprenylcysteine O-methyltransferase Ste14